MFDVRSAFVAGRGSTADRVRQWVRDGGLELARHPSDAMLHILSAPASRRPLPSNPNTLSIGVAASHDGAWARTLRGQPIDAIIAVDTETKNALPDVTFDVGTLEAFDVAHIAERTYSKPSLCIGTSVRFAHRANLWGDTHFALDVSDGMRRQGWRTVIQTHRELERSGNRGRDLVLYLRGLRPAPVVETTAALWVISHPADVTSDECRTPAVIFAAGERAAKEFGGTLLRQATDPRRFRPTPVDPGIASDLLFVGSGRGRTRASVRYALAAGHPVDVVGPGWRRVAGTTVIAKHVENSDLHRFYSSTRVLLNDHWPDMRRYGIISNRVFDAVACGAVVVSDDVDGLDEIFDSTVLTFDDERTFDTAMERASDARSVNLDTRSAGRELVLQGHSFDHRCAVLDHHLRPLVS